MKRDKSIHILLYPHEYKELKEFCDKNFLKMSEFIRDAIREKLERIEHPATIEIDVDKLAQKITNGIGETKELKARIIDQQIKHEKFQDEVLERVSEQTNIQASMIKDKYEALFENFKRAVILLKLEKPISMDELKKLTGWSETIIGQLVEKDILDYDHKTDKFQLNKKRLNNNE